MTPFHHSHPNLLIYLAANRPIFRPDVPPTAAEAAFFRQLTSNTTKAAEMSTSADNYKPGDSPTDGAEAAIKSYLEELKKAAAEGSDWQKDASEINRKKNIHYFFAKYTTFENSPQFTQAMKKEWQTTMVEMVTWHHDNLKSSHWKNGEKRQPGRVAASILQKRATWFEAGDKMGGAGAEEDGEESEDE